jgi:hypothetical protein
MGLVGTRLEGVIVIVGCRHGVNVRVLVCSTGSLLRAMRPAGVKRVTMMNDDIRLQCGNSIVFRRRCAVNECMYCYC